MKKSLQISSVFLALSFATFVNAQVITGDTYCNEYVGLMFPIPSGWHVATNAEVKQGAKVGAKIMGLDGPAARSAIKQMPGQTLLMLSEYPLSQNSQDFNRNIIVSAIDVRDHRAEIQTGADFLKESARGLRQALPNAAISSIRTQILGGHNFYTLKVRHTMQGIQVYQSQLACIVNDYLLVMNMSATSQSSMNQLIQIADRLQIASVPQSIDNSSAAQAFRNKSSLTAPSSKASAGNLLKNIGIVFMIIGGLILFRR